MRLLPGNEGRKSFHGAIGETVLIFASAILRF